MSGGTLIDRLIEEQQALTAVERFTQKHERADFPLQAKLYRNLIPLSKPSPGQQYAFEVNLDKCTGCKACVSACHSLNGLEEHETWRDVGFIVGDNRQTTYQQTVTTACHHCAEPGCLKGCPVGAYDKAMDTGIVRHLDDQCIGCQYCTMKCPYDVPKYSTRLGIVRKCDMCHDRLAVGEAPACVQACPHEAIQITLIDIAQVKDEAAPGTRMLPGAYDSSYTIPTTRYLSKRPIPEAVKSANAHRLHLEHPHWPLIIMLLLSQMAAGIFVTLAAIGLVSPTLFRSIDFPATAAAFLVLNAGLASSTLHLGRPLGAWRFFLGLRTSWMSREILAFGIFAGSASLCLAVEWFLPKSAMPIAIVTATAWVGAGAVFTSVMIYVDTHREFWKSKLTFAKFYGASALLGLIATGLVSAWVERLLPAEAFTLTHAMAMAALGVLGAVVLREFSQYRQARDNVDDPTHRSAVIMDRLLSRIIPLRSILAVILGLLLFGTLLNNGFPAVFFMGLSLVTSGLFLVLERYTFFTAVVPYRMPGGI